MSSEISFKFLICLFDVQLITYQFCMMAVSNAEMRQLRKNVILLSWISFFVASFPYRLSINFWDTSGSTSRYTTISGFGRPSLLYSKSVIHWLYSFFSVRLFVCFFPCFEKICNSVYCIERRCRIAVDIERICTKVSL